MPSAKKTIEIITPFSEGEKRKAKKTLQEIWNSETEKHYLRPVRKNTVL